MAFHAVAGFTVCYLELNCTTPVALGLIRINALGTKSSLQFERRLHLLGHLDLMRGNTMGPNAKCWSPSLFPSRDAISELRVTLNTSERDAAIGLSLVTTHDN